MLRPLESWPLKVRRVKHHISGLQHAHLPRVSGTRISSRQYALFCDHMTTDVNLQLRTTAGACAGINGPSSATHGLSKCQWHTVTEQRNAARTAFAGAAQRAPGWAPEAPRLDAGGPSFPAATSAAAVDEACGAGSRVSGYRTNP